MKEKQNDRYNTPDFVFEQLNSIYNFTLDACASHNSNKCSKYFTIEDNSLLKSWGKDRVFCNPPFSRKDEFVLKAVSEIKKGCPIIVMILPLNSLSSAVVYDEIVGKFHYEVLRQRISFLDDITKKPVTGNPTGTFIVYFKNPIRTKKLTGSQV